MPAVRRAAAGGGPEPRLLSRGMARPGGPRRAHKAAGDGSAARDLHALGGQLQGDPLHRGLTAGLQGPGRTFVGQHTQIRLVQLRRQRPYIKRRASGSSFQPAAAPQDFEVSLRTRRELDRVPLEGLPGGQTVALHREGISARREIPIESDPRYAPTDLIAIRVNYWIAELLLRVFGA